MLTFIELENSSKNGPKRTVSWLDYGRKKELKSVRAVDLRQA
jgi:hypothetical protein